MSRLESPPIFWVIDYRPKLPLRTDDTNMVQAHSKSILLWMEVCLGEQMLRIWQERCIWGVAQQRWCTLSH
jgi:hypothetical protein